MDYIMVKPNLKYKNVISKFPDWIIGTQFAVINEIFIQNRHDKKMEMSEEIKDLITEPFIHIEQKFRRSFDYYNTCNFVLISNHLNCMYINNEERRYWIKVMNCQEMDRGYWAEKWKWADGEGRSSFSSSFTIISQLKIREYINSELHKQLTSKRWQLIVSIQYLDG